MKIWVRKLMGKIPHYWSPGGAWWSLRFPCGRFDARFLYWRTLNMAKHSDNHRTFLWRFFPFPRWTVLWWLKSVRSKLIKRFSSSPASNRFTTMFKHRQERQAEDVEFWEILDMLVIHDFVHICVVQLDAGQQVHHSLVKLVHLLENKLSRVAGNEGGEGPVIWIRCWSFFPWLSPQLIWRGFSFQLGWVSWGTFRSSRRSSRHQEKFQSLFEFCKNVSLNAIWQDLVAFCDWFQGRSSHQRFHRDHRTFGNFYRRKLFNGHCKVRRWFWYINFSENYWLIWWNLSWIVFKFKTFEKISRRRTNFICCWGFFKLFVVDDGFSWIGDFEDWVWGLLRGWSFGYRN